MFKEKYTWMKHIDFILIDLTCLIFSFIFAYYLKFENIYFWNYPEWMSLFVLICFMNLIVMFFINPYSGILKRRYYLQFPKEFALILNQIFGICVLFYVLKIGIIFSREMMITMFSLYGFFSQIIKYFYKKVITKEINSFFKKRKIVVNNENKDLECITKNTYIKEIVRNIIKRMIDIIAGFIGILFLIPLTIVVFIFNRLNEEDGPVFYIQDRIGKDGKIFKMFKFRSMCIDADEKLKLFLEENEDIKKEFYIYRKIKNDPRVTKAGKFLRRTSLDEFPQFINLLLRRHEFSSVLDLI